jgi:nucleoside-diphosphate-sugar epimerase
MRILILGAAGEISQMVTKLLIENTDSHLVLYARNASKRLKENQNSRVTLIDGDFNDDKKLNLAMKDVDIVYINAMGDLAAMKKIAKAMKDNGAKKIIGATILGIYDEVSGAFGKWNKKMVGIDRIKQMAETASVFENSDLDYTLLRLTWLYNREGNTKYILTEKGEPFVGAQVTRQAVAKLILDIIQAKDSRFTKKSLGVSEPGTDWAKPSFY